MNITAAMVDYLANDMRVTRLAGERVYGAELPAYEAAEMPRKTILVMASGGLGAGAGTSSQTPWANNRFDIRCYGETPYIADILHNVVYRAMHDLRVHDYEGMRLVTAVKSGGPLPGRDMDADWPYTIGVYTVGAVYEDRLD